MRLHRDLPDSETAGPCQDKPLSETCISCILDDSAYFKGLSLAAKLKLQKHLCYKSVTRRENLYSEGEPSERLYILLSGEVKIYKTLSDGRQQIHKLATVPGDLIACEDLFLEHHTGAAEAITDATICCISKHQLRVCMDQHQEIVDTLLRTFARNLNAYIRHVSNLGPKNAVERIASYLVFLHETHHARKLVNRVLRESLTRTELADMLGVTQRTLIRGLKQLEAQGCITLTRQGFMILDLTTLAQLGA